MTDAAFTVSFAGPLVTYQDAGRTGHMRYGVSASGPMDRLAFDAAHAALGNRPGQTAIEISLGGLVLTCTSGAVSFAVTGGDFGVEHRGQKQGSWTVLTAEKGDRITIRGGKAGSWAYLTFAGSVACTGWLGSAATHAASDFGGGALQAGQTIRVEDASVRGDRAGEVPRPGFLTDGPMRVVPGPQDQHFSGDALEQFLSERFAVTDAYDRMGMRMRGPELPLAGALSSVKPLGNWWAAVPEERRPDHDSARAYMAEHWQEPWGDRRQEIVFIGSGIDWPALKARLDACLVPALAAHGPDKLPDYADPFPVWRRAEEAA